MPNTHTKSENAKTGMVFFVGAGPGDPELLTLKGRKAIEGAGLVLYAGSLVPPEVVACAGFRAADLGRMPSIGTRDGPGRKGRGPRAYG